ncbi:MAG: hypothetical protein E6G31_04295 [Actinobacteria bacterium]|nr:MAG: hypothetical protein E6G31_04295 [Actinomycetota bacterium]
MAEGKPGYGEAAPGDHLQTSYNLWLVGHQLEHRRTPWRDPYSFQPEAKPRWNFAGWPFGYVYWPLQATLGTVLAWNVFVLFGFLGAGGFTALWLREVGATRGASLAGGLAFAMAPYLQAQWSAGHLLAWIAMLLPLSLYALERLALGAISFFAAYALARLPWAALLAVPALGAGLLADALAVRGTTGGSGRQFRQVEHYSARVPDFLSRDTRVLEGIVYVGWTVAVLAAAGLVVLLLRRRWGMALVLGLGALIPILFSLGGNLPGYHFIWKHVPGLRHTRVPERMMPIACLALAGLVAAAVSRLRLPGAAAVVAVLLLVDLRLGTFHPTAADPHNRVYAALEQHSPGRLLELPVFEAGSQSASVYLYYLMQAPHEHPSGYSTTAPLAADRRLRQLQKTPCRYLGQLGIRQVVTHYGWKKHCGGRLVARAGRLSTYRVP